MSKLLSKYFLRPDFTSHLILISPFLFLTAAVLSSCSCNSANPECDDGIFCNGLETFVDSRCVPGTPPGCDDGLDCTVDLCDPATDSCVNTPDDTFCRDGVFCNGAEVCDTTQGCLPGAPVDCDDSLDCTHDSCDEEAGACLNVPDDAFCDDGVYCNGIETCDAEGGCLEAASLACDDGVGCTVDSCDEAARACMNIPHDSLCADDLFCTENERCDPSLGCLRDERTCDDSIACTLDGCDEAADACVNAPDDAACEADGICSVGLCDPDAGCMPVPAPDGTSCDAGDPALICVDGVCVSRRCGDGYTEPPGSGFPAEECDDGNTADSDSCTPLCRSLDFQVNTTEAGMQDDSVVAVLEDGSFIIAFEDITSTYPSRTDVRLRRYDRRGVPAEASDAVISTDSYSFQIQPALTALPGGGFAAAWADNSVVAAGSYEIKVRTFDASAAPLVEFNASASTPLYRIEPRINYFPVADVLMVTWDDFTTYEGRIMMRRLDLDGAAVDDDEREIPVDTLQRSQPSVAELPDGNFLVFWAGSSGGGLSDIYARLFDVTASPVSDTIEIPSPGCLRNYNAQIALIGEPGSESLVMAWERVCSGSEYTQIGVALIDPSTLEYISGPMAVSPLPGRGFSPTLAAAHLLAADPEGAEPPSDRWVAAVMWAGPNDPARDTDGPYDVYGRRFVLEAGELVPFDASPLLMTTTTRFEQSEPAGAINAAGDLALAWTDYSRTGTDRSSTAIRGRYLPNGWLLNE